MPRYLLRYASFSLPTAKSYEFAFFGDSLVHGGEWGVLLPDINIANRGISADTTNDLINRINHIYLLNPRYCIILIGINDFPEREPEAVMNRYEFLIERLIEKNITPIIHLLLPTTHEYKLNNPKTVKYARVFNNLLSAFAHKNDFRLIDCSHALAAPNSPYLDPALTPDGLHLNSKGYLVWARAINNQLNSFDKRLRP